MFNPLPPRVPNTSAGVGPPVTRGRLMTREVSVRRAAEEDGYGGAVRRVQTGGGGYAERRWVLSGRL